MQELSGQVIRTYEIKEQVGVGGFGSVYRALQSNVDREVAVKVILPEHANRPEFIQRFETEAQLVAHLEHPHIVPLYDYWRDPSGAYLVMRYLRGGNLRESLAEQGAWEAKPTIALINQIAAALDFAHRHNVIHRDLKSDNILLDEEGNAYLTDFGIAKDLVQNTTLTKDMLLGTPAYLAPEQIRGEGATAQSDIYALGILTYEILTGTKPFIESTPAAVLFKQLNDPLPDVSQQRSELSGEVDEVLQQATAKDLSKRYKTAIEFAYALQSALLGDATVSQKIDLNLLVNDGATEIIAKYNPYKGLRAFQQADAGDFFGRNDLIERLLKRLDSSQTNSQFLAVVGPSGSGKSSVIKAGLLPAVRESRLNDEPWYITEMVPGTHPFEELEAALLKIAPNDVPDLHGILTRDERGLVRAIKRILPTSEARVLLLIDQFEEVFTLVDDEERRKLFLDSVMAAAQDERSQVTIIITLRADFYDRPLLYGDFGELIRQRTELVLPLSNSQLQEAIVEPARLVNMELENGLVNAIIKDVRMQPGALPLLQYALTELFERRTGRMMTLNTYQEIGGTSGALARRADEIYSQLDDAEAEAARQIFLRLVTLGDGTEDTRRRVLISELLSLTTDRGIIQRVLDTFGKYRLMTFDRDPVTRNATVEVAHEALIRQWDRMRGWLEESREVLRLQRQLNGATRDWLQADHDPSFLATGIRLQQLEDLAATSDIVLNQDEAAFLQASVEQREARLEAERQRQAHEETLEKRSRRFLGALAVVMTIAAAISGIMAVVAYTQSQLATEAQVIAEDSADTANSLALAANARNAAAQNDPQLALALALEAEQVQDDNAPEVVRVLGDLAYAPGPRYRMSLHTGSVLNVAFSADGQRGASVGLDGQLIIWQVDDQTILQQINLGDGIFAFDVVLHPTEPIAAVALNNGQLRFFDIETGDVALEIAAHEGPIHSLDTSPDGSQIVTGGADKIIKLWDTATGELVQEFEGHTGEIFRVVFSPKGDQIASSSGDETLADTADDAVDRTIRLWSLNGGRTVTIQPNSGFPRTLAYSPDGQTIALGVWDNSLGGTTRLYDVVNGVETARLFGHSTPITDIAFSPDGGTLATVAWDRVVRLWDIRRSVEMRTFAGLPDRILTLEYSPNGEYLLLGTGNAGDNVVTVDSERSIASDVWLWDLQRRDAVRQYHGQDEWLWSVAIHPDGDMAATGSGPLRLVEGANTDTSIHLWNISTGETIATLEGHTNTVDSLDFHPDGQHLLSAGWDGSIILWDIESGEQVRTYSDHAGRVYDVNFSADGSRFISAGGSGDATAYKRTAILYDTDSGQIIRVFSGHESDVYSAVFSPDESLIATGSADGSIRLWNTETGETVRTLSGHTDDVNEVLFSPDGTMLASTSWDDTVRLWDVATGEEIRQFIGHTNNTFGLAFSPDGRTLLTTSTDQTVRLWDVATGEEVHRYLSHTNWIQEVAFTPDGTEAISAAQDELAIVWRVDGSVDSIIAFAQHDRNLRDLTCQERERYNLSLCEPLP
ncbi:MAG: protein kinase [Anaerolineaceae bacterium]|nr:protein kinase [Anaerolineaceae bacterium]